MKILVSTAVLLLFQSCSSSELTAETAYGFFNSPPEISLESVFQLHDNLGKHADAVLYQSEIPREDFRQLKASPEDQEGYLNAVHRQIGSRLTFWIYLLIQDINLESYSEYIKGKDLDTLGYFSTVGLISSDGTPKPALTLWDRFRYLETDEQVYD